MTTAAARRLALQMAIRHGMKGIYAIIAGRIFVCGVTVDPANAAADHFFYRIVLHGVISMSPL